MDGWFQINPSLVTGKGAYTAGFEYDTPWSADHAGVGHLYWQKQPGTGADRINVTWNTGGKSFRTTGDLTQDRVLVLAADGVSITTGRTASAEIPLLSF